MEKLAEKYINDHNNCNISIEPYGVKSFIAPLTEKDNQRKDYCLDQKLKALEHGRVERRCARNVAEWLPLQKLAHVTKLVGSSIAHFGFQNKKGKFLREEETLFLLETNKLELLCEEHILSVEEAFKLLGTDLDKYLVYKKLALEGFKVKINEEESGPPLKIRKTCHSSGSSSSIDGLKKLQDLGPQTFTTERCSEVDYVITSTKGQPQNFNIIFERNKVFNGGNVCNTSNVFAFSNGGDICFYNMLEIDLPTL